MKSKGLALISGASSGLGAEFARQLSQKGYDVLLTARRGHLLNALADEITRETKVSADWFVADLATPEGARAVYAEVKKRGKLPTLLINNAGFGHHGEIIDQDEEKTRAMIQLNVTSLVELSRLFGKSMARRGGGGVINIASVAGFQACPHVGQYGATKAFVLSFTEALAMELKPRGVRVMALCPGMTESEFHEKAGPPYKMQNPKMFTPADVCVRRGLKAFFDGKVVYVDGRKNLLILLAQRFAPRGLVLRVSEFLLRTVEE